MTKIKPIEDYKPIINKFPYVRSKAITQSAHGELCTMGMPGCLRNGDTTVWGHANYDFCGKGMGIKATDWAGAYMCRPCHDLYDGRRQDPMVPESSREFYFWRAHVKSMNRLIERGIVKIE